MGKKKHKKMRDIWDVSNTEQLEASDDFYKLSKGEKTIFDIGGKVKQAPLPDSGFRKDLEEVVVKDLREKNRKVYQENIGMKVTENSTPDYDEVVSGKPSNEKESIPYAAVRNGEIQVPKTKEEPEEEQNYDEEEIKENAEETVFQISRVYFDVDKSLDRLTVDDGVSPTTLDFGNDQCPNMKQANYDNADVADKINLLYYYIITNKFPQAIYTEKDFFKYWGTIATINRTKFILLASKGYIFVYDIDADGREDFINVPDYYDYDAEMTLNMYVTLALRTADVHNRFDGTNSDTIDIFYESENKYNQQEDVYQDVLSDAVTVSVPKANFDNDTIKKNLGVLKYDNLQEAAKDLIDELTGKMSEEASSEESEPVVKEEPTETKEDIFEPVETVETAQDIELSIPEEAEEIVIPEDVSEVKPESDTTVSADQPEEPTIKPNPIAVDVPNQSNDSKNSMELTIPVIHRKH